MTFIGQLKESLDPGDAVILVDEPLARHTSFRIGGLADALIMINNERALRQVRQFSSRMKLPAVILGRGTNVLISDQGLRGIVVKLTGEFNSIQIRGNRIIAGAAALLDTIAETAEACGLAGADFLAGIPGTIGGALLTNAGAFGKSVGSILERVETMDVGGKVILLNKTELRDEYRQAVIPPGFWAIRVVLCLVPGQGRAVQLVREERWSRHPKEPSAGSFFKNPPEGPAGRLIEQCGLKGISIGGAAVSEKHANFIVNKGNARFVDVYELGQVVKATVEEKTGIELTEEVRMLPVSCDPASVPV
ncbi:MAG: UDP-N-acetylmuramate dehydrogenase [bacterium]